MGNGTSPTREFRREAVRLALTSGRTRRENTGPTQERDITQKPQPCLRRREIPEACRHRCREGQLPDQPVVSCLRVSQSGFFAPQSRQQVENAVTRPDKGKRSALRSPRRDAEGRCAKAVPDIGAACRETYDKASAATSRRRPAARRRAGLIATQGSPVPRQ